MQLTSHTARTARENGRPGRLCCLLRRDTRLYRRMIVGRRFPFNNLDGIGRAGRQTVTEPVTVIILHKPRLAINHLNGILMTGLGTKPAAITFFFIYMNNFTNHLLLHFFPGHKNSANHRLDIGLYIRNATNAKGINEYLRDVRGKERRQRRSEMDILHAEI